MDASQWDWTRPVFDHVHLRVADLDASKAFYSTVLEPLGIPLLFHDGELAQFANLALSADGPPGSDYYAAYLLDPDGNNVEAVQRSFPG